GSGSSRTRRQPESAAILGSCLGESQAHKCALAHRNCVFSATCQIPSLSPLLAGRAESAIMATSMPSPIGHTLAALTVRWVGRPATGDDATPRARLLGPLTLACVAVAVLPDVDLLFYRWHRTVTHSIGA